MCFLKFKLMLYERSSLFCYYLKGWIVLCSVLQRCYNFPVVRKSILFSKRGPKFHDPPKMFVQFILALQFLQFNYYLKGWIVLCSVLQRRYNFPIVRKSILFLKRGPKFHDPPEMFVHFFWPFNFCSSKMT